MRILMEREGDHDEVSMIFIIIGYLVNMIISRLQRMLQEYMMSIEPSSTM